MRLLHSELSGDLLMCYVDIEGKSHLLSSGSKERKFLSTIYCKVMTHKCMFSAHIQFCFFFRIMQNDIQSPYYGFSAQPTEQYISAEMSVVNVLLLKESLIKLIPMGLSIMAEIK